MTLDKTNALHRWFVGSTLLCMMITPGFAAILTGSIGTHDPSRVIDCDGTYYMYSTGGGMKYSTDRINWTSGPSPFPNPPRPAGSPTAAGSPSPLGSPSAGFRQFMRGSSPPSMKALIPLDQGIWAPDVIYYNHRYNLYYSVSGRGGFISAIGLMTSPTLNPKDPAYHWTDTGIVTTDHDDVDHRSAIDPCPFIDAKGDLWLSYGSGYANGTQTTGPTIYMMKLDNATGLSSSMDTHRYPVAFGHIEASYVFYHGGYYYLFWNSGGCCNGAKSSYTIHMARSRTVTGPYVDRNGGTNSSSIFLGPTVVKNSAIGNEHGPGQIGILSEGGIDRCTYHYYPDSGRSVAGDETIVWDSGGWPAAGEDLPPGTYKITSVESASTLGVQGSSGDEGTPIELQTYTHSPYQQWTVAFTSGTDSKPDGYYSITSAGTGKALRMAQSDAPHAAVIGQLTPVGDHDQDWLIEQASDGKYIITSRASGRVLSARATGAASNSGISLVKGSVDSQVSRAQEWSFSAP